MSTAHTGSAASCHRIDLIDKDDTWCVFLCFLKKITDTGCTDTDKHLHEIRTGNTKKRHACFSCNRFCKQCLTCSRRSL